jgi:hypothetical protein
MTETQAPREPAKFRGRDGNGDGYRFATVCGQRHEHSVVGEGYPGDDLGFCGKCGAEVLSACPSCGTRLRGIEWSMTPPPGRKPTYEIYEWSFCDGCGSPYPWAGREELISHLINLLASQDISDHDRLIVAEHLRQLQKMTPGGDQRGERQSWQMIRKYAPGLIKAAPSVIKAVEAVRTIS